MFFPRWTNIGKNRRSHCRLPQFEYLEPRRVLATVTLNTDSGTLGELRTAIVDAAPGETIDFNLTAGNETIVLDMSLGELVLDKNLNVDGINTAGSGVEVTIHGDNMTRVIHVDDDNTYTHAAVTLSNLTVAGGMADQGAGIWNTEALTLFHATVNGNTATNGSGGGIYSVGDGSALYLQNSTVDSNYAATGSNLAGGGIAVALGSVTINDSSITNNTATGTPGTSFGGGGIALSSNSSDLSSSLDVTISATMISGNVVMGEQDPNFPYHGVNPSGGGIYANGYGQITINASTISGNSAYGTGANQATGGGLKFYGGMSTLDVDIDDTNILANYSTNRGGGIGVRVHYGSPGSIDLDVSKSIIASNQSVLYAGGLFQYGVTQRVTTRINESMITGNTSGASGGVANWNAYLLLEASEVSGNVGINPSGSPYGGGIGNRGLFLTAYPYETPPTLIVRNSTISGNSTTGRGGGIHSYNGHLDIFQSTISGNTADADGAGVFLYTDGMFENTPFEARTSIERSTVTTNRSFGGGGGIYTNYSHNLFTMSNSIVGANMSTNIGSDIRDNSSQSAIRNNTTFSFITDNSGSGFAEANPVPDVNGNFAGGGIAGVIDAKLGPLANNGGPTPTHLPNSDSLAVDAADPAIVPGMDTDQRGYERVIDGDLFEIVRMDMGSVELGATAPLVDGDFNDDGSWDHSDINLLTAETAAGTSNPDFDLTGEGDVNMDDINAWLVEAGVIDTQGVTGNNSFLPGDANLDGFVDGFDFLQWNAAKFTTNTRWGSGTTDPGTLGGNFDGSTDTDGNDFIIWNGFKFQSSTGATPIVLSTVPSDAHEIQDELRVQIDRIVDTSRMNRQLERLTPKRVDSVFADSHRGHEASDDRLEFENLSDALPIYS
jgi:hypothetical protein